jgi:hypothetical protein
MTSSPGRTNLPIRTTRTDTIPFYPFARARGEFKATFQPTAHDQIFMANGTIPFRPEFSLSGITPSVEFRFDPDALAQALDERPKDLAVAILLRDQLCKRHDMLARWPLEECPRTWTAEDARPVSERSQLSAIVFLAKERNAKPYRAHRLGSTLASQSVTIAPETDSLNFKLTDVPPAGFLEVGMPADTVWSVHLKTDNVEEAPGDAIEVWVNLKHKERLLSLLQSPAAKTFAASACASIFAAVIRCTLAKAKGPPRQEGGLLWSVCKKVAAVPGAALDFAELRDAAKTPGDPRIDAAAQMIAELHKRLG